MDKDRELALVRDCQNGNRQAFETLVRYFERPVYNAAYRILGLPEDARDVTQTTFLKLFERLDSYDPTFRLFSWIYRIAVNEAIHQLKLRNRGEPFREPDVEDTSSDAAVRTELRREVQVALMELPTEQRILIVLRYFSECSYWQISEILKVPEKTVKSRLFTARQQLKRRLENHGILST